VAANGLIPHIPNVVFRITPDGALTTLYTFSGYADGGSPAPGLVRGTDGNFYGATRSGGLTNGGGYGTLFSITQDGALTTLYTFANQGIDGETPAAPPFQATDGNFYGTTDGGGADADGTVFRLAVGLGPFVETAPASGVVGTTVLVLGYNLTGATGVTFNGTRATFTVVSDTEIETTVPLCATTGLVRVTTPSGTLESNVAFWVPPRVTARGCMLPMSQ
jgi:uncharacterized repeat protein (TIGR03803 family)